MSRPVFIKSKKPAFPGTVCNWCGVTITDSFFYNKNPKATKKHICAPCNEARMEQVMSYVQAWKDRQKEVLGDPDGHLRSIMAESQ